ncbi:4'-phosphopantetheinyl transferase family protein [Deinococcus multiflagellatus]|uniref:4'-phosphopantetheinyl transferase family protein n=1 Tax=Deinococcus multiflagellatus TaxID=1656887 RepID=A0ABW1ZS14_9DEIO|nr:4'-phosphopantetheinyl transferase superfamily protein [Deinococcus multiflagellatus]MBZ9716129.1 4'-phosphopantetheinyl transferase superfamily protein [Deinococcus multiflagellatus]
MSGAAPHTAVYLAHADDFAGLVALLTPEEHIRARAIALPAPRRRYVAARALVRTVLAARLGAPPQALTFALGPYGKPYLVGLDVPFNLSHTGDHLALAVGNGPVGVDLEEVRPLQNSHAMLQTALGPLERERLQRLPPAQHLAAFYRAWACKEAILKAQGVGLTYDLHAVQLTVPADLHAAPVPEQGPEGPFGPWQLFLHWVHPTRVLALASTGPGITLIPVQTVEDREGRWIIHPAAAVLERR